VCYRWRILGKQRYCSSIHPILSIYTYHSSIILIKILNLYHQISLQDGEEDPEGVEVTVSGRIMVRRVFGKLAFFTLQDESGTLQLYLEEGRLQEQVSLYI